MEKRNFYGEYTLLHWIELILQKNILLPDYQRNFVWSKEQVENFLKNLKEGIFVPPVIIGSLEHPDGNNENIILDGQQRLTSILLGYIGLYPKEEAFKASDDPLYVSDAVDPDEDENDEIIIEWSFKLLTNDSKNKTKADILANIDNTKYEMLSAEAILDDWFLNNNYLGFSYIVPMINDESEQQKFYSTVFHDINLQGVALLSQDSRRSLYYLNKDLVEYFEPHKVIPLLKLTQGAKAKRYDYVRLLAFLTEYKHTHTETAVAKNCRSQETFELYYDAFINSVVTDTDSPRFGKFSTMIGLDNVEERMTRLKEYIVQLGFNSTFPNIIDADTKLFGLVFQVLFNDKSLKEGEFGDLKNALNQKINAYKKNEKHRNSPNGLSHLRKRLKDSIVIYSRYIV